MRSGSPLEVDVGAGVGESLRRFARLESLAMVVTMPLISSSQSCMCWDRAREKKKEMERKKESEMDYKMAKMF